METKVKIMFIIKAHIIIQCEHLIWGAINCILFSKLLLNMKCSCTYSFLSHANRKNNHVFLQLRMVTKTLTYIKGTTGVDNAN